MLLHKAEKHIELTRPIFHAPDDRKMREELRWREGLTCDCLSQSREEIEMVLHCLGITCRSQPRSIRIAFVSKTKVSQAWVGLLLSHFRNGYNAFLFSAWTMINCSPEISFFDLDLAFRYIFGTSEQRTQDDCTLVSLDKLVYIKTQMELLHKYKDILD